jgi:ribonuclease BN (tRNA processing enzyme)
MRLTILGSGTIVPSATRKSSGYFLELADASVMLDCGAGSVHSLAQYHLPWQRMSHLFISHFHADHIGELASLLTAFRVGISVERNEPLLIVGPNGLDRVVEGLKMAFGKKLLESRFPVKIQMLEPGQTIELGRESKLTVAKTPHTPESLAVRIERDDRAICYTGDTAFSEELAGFFYKADVLVSECSYREPRAGVRHLSVSEAARMATLAEVSKLIVSHFYFDVDEARLKEELQTHYSGEVIVARDGMRVEIE